MAVDTFHHEFGAIQINSVLWKEFNGAETYPRFTALHRFPFGVFQFQSGYVQVRVLCRPGPDVHPVSFHQLFLVRILNLMRNARFVFLSVYVFSIL